MILNASTSSKLQVGSCDEWKRARQAKPIEVSIVELCRSVCITNIEQNRMEVKKGNYIMSTFRNMEMIREYESDGKTTSSSNDELGPRQSRQVYLVTYSQADRTKFPTRHSLAEAVVASFSSRSAVVSKQPLAFVKHVL